ncbi:hypothetical protein PSCFBP3800_04273 [Pseudomonas syringae group genomosp. 3]|uniref:Uncharacterized protein n=1 Tax=Pseudomonas syringae group genomosp. 3 TaxID=251701 RepID=A0A2K4WI50_9PSED|nr:hypothetical protein CFBP6411_04137 [Pseudomonas syringae group genomosp. 3]SPF19729.1 hypothetical protein PSCFBP3800_04273 [Pseudomonas syringae group genomosp. 3]
MILRVTHHFTGLGVNVVVPFDAIRAFELDLINELASKRLVQLGVMDCEARVCSQGLFVELFEVTYCARLVQANYFIRTDIGLGSTGSSSESNSSEEGRHKFHKVFLLIDQF